MRIAALIQEVQHPSSMSASLQGADTHQSINQTITCFSTFPPSQAETLFKLLLKYRPEDKTEKRERLKAEAEARAAGKEVRGAGWSMCRLVYAVSERGKQRGGHAKGGERSAGMLRR
jgi:hypothetical protein